jgi:hypothetical protein
MVLNVLNIVLTVITQSECRASSLANPIRQVRGSIKRQICMRVI